MDIFPPTKKVLLGTKPQQNQLSMGLISHQKMENQAKGGNTPLPGEGSLPIGGRVNEYQYFLGKYVF